MRQFLQLTATQDTINADDTKKNFLIICLKCIAIAGCPILLIVMLAAIISTVAQTKGLLISNSLNPNSTEWIR